jgi:hypothetical protein
LPACDVYALVGCDRLIASREIKNNSLACDVNALMAATANRELENENYWLAGCDVYALVGCNRSDHGELGSKNYSLACNVNALVAATANRELENKHYSLACDVYALVGRDCHSACRLH